MVDSRDHMDNGVEMRGSEESFGGVRQREVNSGSPSSLCSQPSSFSPCSCLRSVSEEKSMDGSGNINCRKGQENGYADLPCGNGNRSNGAGMDKKLEVGRQISETDEIPCTPGKLEHYLSIEGKSRKQGTLRSLAAALGSGNTPGESKLISLAAGFPTPSLFPICSLSVGMTPLASAREQVNGCEKETEESNSKTKIIDLDMDKLIRAQQYNFSLPGHPDLVDWVIDHIRMVHAPPSTKFSSGIEEFSCPSPTHAAAYMSEISHDVLITNGANHALELITGLFLDRGDTMIVEEYTYPVITESICGPKGIEPLSVSMDEHGIIVEDLERVLNDRLETIEKANASGDRGVMKPPKLLYTVPTGHNPTGLTTSAQRRKQIYKICRKYDLWIIEDDPYYYLQYGSENVKLLSERIEELGSNENLISSTILQEGPSCVSVPGLAGISISSNEKDTVNNFKHPRSYLSMDIDCRVIRVDTFAKFLAPGLRLGWVTARGDVIEKLTAAIHAHTVGPCGLSQAVVSSMLQAWGPTGLDKHLHNIQRTYCYRCGVLVYAANKYLTGLAEWHVPSAGMFLWVKILGIQDSFDIWDGLKAFKVIVCPGKAMLSSEFAKKDHIQGENGNSGNILQSNLSPYIRVSFSSASEEDLIEGIRRIAKVIQSHRKI